MLGSLNGWQVIAREQRVLHELALYAIGPDRPARATASPGIGAGLTSHRIREQLLILAPPVRAEQRLAHVLPGSAPAHRRPDPAAQPLT